MRVGLGPDDEHVGDGRIGNPHLRAVQHVAVRGLARRRLHPAGVGARVGFGQAEAADELAAGELRQVLHALFFRPVGVDRVHHEARLHRHHGPVARIHPLDLARDKAIGDVGRAETAVFLGDGDAQKAHFAHLAEDRRIGVFLAVGMDHAGLQLFLRIGAGRVAQHPLVLGQLVVQAKRIFPVEPVQVGRILGLEGHRFLLRDAIGIKPPRAGINGGSRGRAPDRVAPGTRITPASRSCRGLSRSCRERGGILVVTVASRWADPALHLPFTRRITCVGSSTTRRRSPWAWR